MEPVTNPQAPQPEGIQATQPVAQPPQLEDNTKSVLDLLTSKSRKTKGKVIEIIEIGGNPSLTEDGKIPVDEFNVPILSFDGVRIENNNQLCRFAFKTKKIIDQINTKPVIVGEGDTARILARASFKLKRSDDTTYFISSLLDFEPSNTT